MEVAAHTEAAPSATLGSSRFSWLLFFPIFLVVYLLSTGPACKLYKRYPGVEPVIIIFYSPVTWLYHHSAFTKKALDWYVQDLWGV